MHILSLKRTTRKYQKPQLEIQNVVATADLNQHLALDAILQVTPGARFNPERFPGLIYRMTKPAAVFLVFASGKIVATGTKTENDVDLAIEKLLDTLELNGLISFHEHHTPTKQASPSS
jgi:transcription initiation factor TFIID TATA-box-binding protein